MIKTKIIFIFIISLTMFSANALENCKWDNSNGLPCVTISKTQHFFSNSQSVVSRFLQQNILDSGAKSTIDLIKYVSGIDYYQNGPIGQTG